ncbi:MAG: crossover junction endodeoxyribonuclease RuvC [Phycisphaeraceae bacterium]|nr:crossover junction endodeoxyribonuclease RuvC [Phycisphaeraceae bacterium]
MVKVLGIDPGLRVTGYACVESAGGGGAAGRVVGAGGAGGGSGAHRAGFGSALVEAGVIRLSSKSSVADRLVELERDLAEIIERQRPAVVAVEKLYAHYAHPTTAIVMGHARGVVLLQARRAGLGIVELGATEVKKSLTGNGHASKSQMQDGVKSLLGLPRRPEPADVADAIAIALCAMRRAR